MTDERWQLAYTIFETAACPQGQERESYIGTAAPDEELAQRVRAMLDEVPSGDSISGNSGNNGAPPPSTQLPNGTAIGRFVITGFVGQGGMGRVYAAHDPDLNREAALKVIAHGPEVSGSEMFIGEAQAASALNHPNIVTVYEVIRSGATVAIAMELVNGTSLRQHCGASQPVEKIRSGEGRLHTPWQRHTSAVSSIATSSRRTSCCGRTDT